MTGKKTYRANLKTSRLGPPMGEKTASVPRTGRLTRDGSSSAHHDVGSVLVPRPYKKQQAKVTVRLFVCSMASPLDIPAFQRAWRVVAKGTPYQALSLQSNVPVPSQLSQGDVLVKVQAAALNPMYASLSTLHSLVERSSPSMSQWIQAHEYATQLHRPPACHCRERFLRYHRQ